MATANGRGRQDLLGSQRRRRNAAPHPRGEAGLLKREARGQSPTTAIAKNAPMLEKYFAFAPRSDLIGSKG